MLAYAVIGFGVILVASFLRGDRDKYTEVCVGVSIPLFLFLLLPLSFLTSYLRPVTFDLQLRQIDLWLGLDGFALTRWLLHRGLYGAVNPIYDSLPLMIAIGWALERSRTLLRSVVIGGVMALPIYLLVPASGPQYAFSNFPHSNAVPAPVGMHPRNCVPSMHLAWALLLALNARNRVWRAVLLIYLGLTIVVTVAGGEHYFIDLIVAVPFAFGVQYLAERGRREVRSPATAPLRRPVVDSAP